MTQSSFLLVERLKTFPCSEQEGYTPYSRKSYDCINYTAEQSVLTTAYPCNYIKLKKTYASPVKSAYYCEYQRDSIHDHCQKSSLMRISFRSQLVFTHMLVLCKIYFGSFFVFRLKSASLGHNTFRRYQLKEKYISIYKMNGVYL